MRHLVWQGLNNPKLTVRSWGTSLDPGCGKRHLLCCQLLCHGMQSDLRSLSSVEMLGHVYTNYALVLKCTPLKAQLFSLWCWWQQWHPISMLANQLWPRERPGNPPQYTVKIFYVHGEHWSIKSYSTERTTRPDSNPAPPLQSQCCFK